MQARRIWCIAAAQREEKLAGTLGSSAGLSVPSLAMFAAFSFRSLAH
jgi:hypothetical protein